jgi:hypothetical protein
MPPPKKINIRGLRALIREWTGGKTRSLPTLRRWLQLGVHLDATNELVTVPSTTCPTTGTRELLYSDAVALCQRLFGEKKQGEVARVQGG